MAQYTREQIRHKVINLSKTLKALEQSVDGEDWAKYLSTSDRTKKWLKAQSVLAGVKQCRTLLLEVAPNDFDSGLGDSRSISGEQFHDNAKQILERLEISMMEANQDLRPRVKRSIPILPTLPIPELPKNATKEGDTRRASASDALVSIGEAGVREQEVILPTEKLLDTSLPDTPVLDISPQSFRNPAKTLIPPTLPSTSELTAPRIGPTSSGSTDGGTGEMPGFLKTSTAVQEDLADQLAQMARQLKLNAQHFSEALEKDKGVVQETEEKVDRNYDTLTKERVRLRDHRSKSRGTTWIVILSILVVFIGFFVTFFVIRIT